MPVPIGDEADDEAGAEGELDGPVPSRAFEREGEDDSARRQRGGGAQLQRAVGPLPDFGAAGEEMDG